MIESLSAASPSGTEAFLLRTSAGAEFDLVLRLPGYRKTWAIEISRALAPKLERGVHLARETLAPERRLVV